MSGIMGLYHPNLHPVAVQDLQQMMKALAHRGSDDSGYWAEENIGLAHCMLWTTPESLLEKLPQISATGNLVITADVRLDNREELVQVLDLPDRPVEKITDSEFILAAYEKWGEDCPDYLLGDFAFAIWNRTLNSLFCVRDHLGVKPFYYCHQASQTFSFASEIKALLCLPTVPQRLNETRLADFLALMMEDKVSTTYKGILRLPPAHAMVVDSSGVRVWSYWSLDPQRELRLNSNEAYAQTFRDIFSEAVRCRLRSAFPIVSHLSGGLDSSAVTCVARRLLSQSGNATLHTISSVFDKVTECDERPFINAVLEQGNLTPHFVAGDEAGPLSNLDHIFQFEDEALLGPSHFYPWVINRAAKDLNFRLSLDGFDGDTVVGHGIPRLTELARRGDWKTLLFEVEPVSLHYEVPQFALLEAYSLPHLHELLRQWRWIDFVRVVHQIHRRFRASRKRLLLEYGVKPLLLKLVPQFWRGDRPIPSLQSWLNHHAPLIHSDFAQRIGLPERASQFKADRNPPSTVREEQWRSLTSGIWSYTLEQMDQYAAMFSLEARHPFMDKRLVEFCLSLPAEQKLYQGWGRVVMRRALEGILPEQVQWRTGKADLTPNFDDGLLNRNRALLEQVMVEQINLLKPYINLNFLRAAYQRTLSAGKPTTGNDSTAIWQAVILSLWLHYKKVMP